MKNLKLKVKSLLIATLIASSFTIKASADTSDIYLSSVKNASNNIELSIDNIEDDIRAFQIKIKLNSAVEFDSLEWDSSLNSSTIVKNYKLNDDNSIDIYVTSDNILNKDDILEIGTIVLKNPENIQNYGSVVVEGEDFKYIYSEQNKKGEVSNLESLFSNKQDDGNGTGDDSNGGNDAIIPPTNDDESLDNGSNDENGDVILPPSNEDGLSDNNNSGSSGSGSSHKHHKNESENDNSVNDNTENNNTVNGNTNSNVNNQNLNWVKNPDNTWKLLNDGKAVSGWSLYNNKWYFMNESGIMQTGWKLVNNKWYYLNTDGDMATDWKFINNKWYYLNANGDMATGWKLVNNKWYYLNTDGDMATGWKLVNNKWYYLNTDGDMATGWKFVNNKWYYLNSSGDMAYNTVIDGYRLGSDGAWIK